MADFDASGRPWGDEIVTAVMETGRGRKRAGLATSLLAWLWPDAREQRDERAGLLAWSSLLGWLWPSAVHDETYGRPHGLMAILFGWMWPNVADRGVRRWWHFSWLWSWMWPGKVLGPDGEICPLAPWHPALRPEVCPGETWHHKLRRHGPVMFMMFGATALASPTLMEGNGILDGGRLNLFRADGPTTPDQPTGGADSNGDGSGAEPADDGGAGGATSGGGGAGGGAGGGDGDATGVDGSSDGGGDPATTNDDSAPTAGDPAPTTGDGGTTLVGPGFDP
ncbi:MAG: hypothetical protein KIS90_12930, partial [Phenylobacterium sp.]|nr:hypothetical protein [Phenylobacterium sp.]